MSILLFIAILLVLIIGHELGHFTIAKWVGMKVTEFGVGFPPKLWGKQVGETEYTVNALPFGGFVRIFGEDESEKNEDRAFARHSRLAQAAVLFAGPGANVVLGFLAFSMAFMIGVPIAIDDGERATVTDVRIVVSELLPASPAAVSGLQVGDTLLSFQQGDAVVPIQSPKDISVALAASHDPITLSARRGSEALTFVITPVAGLIEAEPERYAVGVGSLLVGTVLYSPIEAVIKAGEATVNGLWSIVVGLSTLIGSAFTLSGSIKDLSGPVGIATLVGDAATFGAGQVLALAAVISLNLAILNLLPFPALDGGRLAMLAIETVRGRAIRSQTSMIVNTVGFVVLILLMLVVTWNDIAKLVG